jgi:glycosyltransferase involved in cell wall biosynthesis
MGRPRKREIKDYICSNCNIHFKKTEDKRYTGNHFCCKKCKHKFEIGKNASGFIRGKIKKNGYWRVLAEYHPHCDEQGYVYEHRLVMEKKLGRLLDSKEQVHHINGIRTDNRIENLELTNILEHNAKYHNPGINPQGKISVHIPFANRKRKRLMAVIDAVKKNNLGLVKSITVIDCASDMPIKKGNGLSGIKIIRLENKPFNKSFALNKSILEEDSEYIMTLDADILLSKEHFKEIEKNLSKEKFICDTNVRRVNLEDIKKEYPELIRISRPWGNLDRTQLVNQAHGGIQVYSKDFFNNIGGIMESLGFYSGAMDSYTWIMARLNNLTIIDLSYPLIHIDHPKLKEKNFNLSKEEEAFAKNYRAYKGHYLDFIITTNLKKNPEPIGGKTPSDTLVKKFKEELMNRDEIIKKALDEGKKEVTLFGQTFVLEKEKPSILISVINNYDSMPNYFVWDLMSLYIQTKRFYPDVDIQQANACDVNLMRNLSVLHSLGDNDLKKRYDYIVQLDTDHKYPKDFIIKFVSLCEQNKWPIITGLTSSQKEPHYNTQYYKLQEEMNTKENTVSCPKPVNNIIDIEASGPVGMVINTAIFSKIKFPFYLQEYQVKEGEHNKQNFMTVGGDVNFCKKLKEAGIPIKCHLGYSFPHGRTAFLNRRH